MLNKVLRTPVDDLVDILKSIKKCKISYLSSKLNLPLENIEKWLVILEEYGILNLKYEGFEGYVEYKEKNLTNIKKDSLDIDKLKSDFIRRSHLKQLDSKKIKDLWKLFVKKYQKESKSNAITRTCL